MRYRKFVIAALAIGVISGGPQAFAQNKWTEQGPGPILNDGNTALPGMSPVAGAINAIVPSPASADVIFAGTVNGGVWKTSNATAAFDPNTTPTAPAWTPLTDNQLPELSIKSLAMSPVDSNTLFAGTGSTSSAGSLGGPGIGIARSTDGGATWEVLDRSTFAGRVIYSIVPTRLNGGETILAATWLDGGGVYRSTDNGVRFTRISGTRGSGLPNAGVTSLIADPSNPNRFYAGAPGGAGGGVLAGVYRSNNGGVTWTAVNTGLSGLSTSVRILLTIHNDDANNVVYADVIAANGTLSGVFRSANQGGNWTSLGVPSPPIYRVGDTEGGQGALHGAIAADPSDPNVVFISGDTQTGPFPNANGCGTYVANVYRYTGTAWESVVCNGANGTAPHADSRFMAFDTNGDLLETDDGGIVRLVNPNSNPNLPTTRQWVAVDGDIKTVEFHSIAYDPLSNIVFGGAQDNGTSYQTKTLLQPDGFTWNQQFSGDGGVVGIDANQNIHPGTSIRYSSSQNFGCGFNSQFTRSTWNASNVMQSAVLVGLNITAGTGTGMTLCMFDNIDFYQPFAINAVDPTRMLIATDPAPNTNGTGNLYESLDQGDSLTNLGPLGAPRAGGGNLIGQPIAYGGKLLGVSYPGLFYVGAGNQIFHRVMPAGPITALGNYPGGTVITIKMNPNNYRQVYVSDINNRVWGSSNEGATWRDLTGDLNSLTSQVTTIEVFNTGGLQSTLYAGGFGVFQISTAFGEFWKAVTGPEVNRIPNKIPPALVLDLHYDYTMKVLVAGTLGRGAWLFGAGTPTATAGGELPSTSSVSSARTAAKSRLPGPPPVAYPRPPTQ